MLRRGIVNSSPKILHLSRGELQGVAMPVSFEISARLVYAFVAGYNSVC